MKQVTPLLGEGGGEGSASYIAYLAWCGAGVVFAWTPPISVCMYEVCVCVESSQRTIQGEGISTAKGSFQVTFSLLPSPFGGD